MTTTQDLTERQAHLEESVRRHTESADTLAALEQHIESEVKRLESEIATLGDAVEAVPSSPDGGALARHDLRQRIIDAQLTCERHVHELALLRDEISDTKAGRDAAVSELELLKADQ
jgi:hypothetical protein